MSDDDEPTTAEQILARVEQGALPPERAQLELLAEIANGLWCLVGAVDEMLDMARDDGTPRGRVH